MDEIEMRKRIQELLDSESKADRMKRMFTYNDYGTLSPELAYIVKGGTISAVFGGFFGAMKSMNQTRDNFLRSNEATAFDSQHLARRRLTDSMTLSAMKGFFRDGFKFGSFTTAYMLITLTAANYNNKVTVWEHAAAGAIIGSVSRIMYGPKGILVAGLLGSFLGLVSGGVIKTSMWLSGTSFTELRYWQHEYFNEQFTMKRKENEK